MLIMSNVCRVFFRGVTWLRDSHGLFDYESHNIAKKNMKTQTTGRLVRMDNELEFETAKQEESESVRRILEINQDKSKLIRDF